MQRVLAVILCALLSGCICMGSHEDQLIWYQDGLWREITGGDASKLRGANPPYDVTTPSLSEAWGLMQLVELRWTAYNESPRDVYGINTNPTNFLSLRGLTLRGLYDPDRTEDDVARDFRTFVPKVSCVPSAEVETILDTYLASRRQVEEGRSPLIYEVRLPDRACASRTLEDLEANGSLRAERNFEEGQVWLVGSGWMFHYRVGRITLTDEDTTLTAWGDGRNVVRGPDALLGGERALRRAATEMLAARGVEAPTYEGASFDDADC